jgi:hypothetical protein
MQLELNTSVEMCLVGDIGFPLMYNLIRPFSHNKLSKEEFIIRLSKAGHYLERALVIIRVTF